MTVLLIQRLFSGLIVLGIVVVMLFFLQQLSPIDASSFFISPDFPETMQEQIRKNMGLDQPAYVQFWKWLSHAAQLDFQHSLVHSRPVSEMILAALPNTIILSGIALLLIFGLGILIGIVQAIRQYTKLDLGLTLGSLFLYSMPSFWLAIMLILCVSLLTDGNWPIFGMEGNEITLKRLMGEPVGFMEQAGDLLQHLLLPALALGIPSAAGIARYTRSSMLEVIRQDFVRTAKAKGLAPFRVIFKHTLRNALIPVVTLLGLSLPFLISGAVLVETIFAWPGMGRLMVTAVLTYDYTVVMASSILLTIFVILGNLIADVLYAVIDPRIRYG